MPNGTKISLEALLESRERRAARQLRLLNSLRGWGEIALFSFTVNYPGDVKLNPDTLAVHAAGVAALDCALADTPVIYRQTLLPATGPEAFWVVSISPASAKARAVNVEQTHPLGRLFDIDVLGPGGVPLSRAGMGLAPRACLLCGGDTAVCRRSALHSVGELRAYIGEMVEEYGLGNVGAPPQTPPKGL